MNKTRTFSYRPSSHPSGVELDREDKPFVDVVAEALGLKYTPAEQALRL